MKPASPPYGIERDEPKPDWHLKAACRDLSIEDAHRFYFEPERGMVPPEALELCQSCPVRADCIIAGLQQPGRGRQDSIVWGGLRVTQQERVRKELAEEWGIAIEPREDYAYHTYAMAPERPAEEAVSPLTPLLEAAAGNAEAVVDVVAEYRELALANMTTD